MMLSSLSVRVAALLARAVYFTYSMHLQCEGARRKDAGLSRDVRRVAQLAVARSSACQEKAAF